MSTKTYKRRQDQEYKNHYGKWEIVKAIFSAFVLPIFRLSRTALLRHTDSVASVVIDSFILAGTVVLLGYFQIWSWVGILLGTLTLAFIGGLSRKFHKPQVVLPKSDDENLHENLTPNPTPTPIWEPIKMNESALKVTQKEKAQTKFVETPNFDEMTPDEIRDFIQKNPSLVRAQKR